MVGEVLGGGGMGERWTRKLQELRKEKEKVGGDGLVEWLECEGESKGVRES